MEGGQDGTVCTDHNVPTDVSLTSPDIVRVDFRKTSYSTDDDFEIDNVL